MQVKLGPVTEVYLNSDEAVKVCFMAQKTYHLVELTTRRCLAELPLRHPSDRDGLSAVSSYTTV